jgi:hypothetical protein
MFSFALLGMITLALDLSHLAEVKDRANGAARLASLAAVEASFRNAPVNYGYYSYGWSTPTRLCAALKAGQMAVESNQYLGSSGTTERPRLKPHAVIPNCDAPNSSDVSAPAATLQPGLWHTAAPASPILGTADPCSGNYPCFQAYDPIANPDIPPTAYRVEGEIYQDIDYYLADKLFGVGGGFKAFARAIATVIPRRMVFAVDTSPSMVRSTHLSRPSEIPNFSNDQADDPGNGHGGEFAFYTTEDAPLCAEPQNGTTDKNHDEQWFYFCGHSSLTDKIAPNLPAPYPRGAAVTPGVTDYIPTPLQQTDVASDFGNNRKRPKLHFATEYIQKAVLNDSDYAATNRYQGLHPNPTIVSPWGSNYAMGTARQFYMVDVGMGRFMTYYSCNYNSATNTRTCNSNRYGFWDPPQPLSTVLYSLRAGITEMRSRAVTGDRAGITFFDNSLLWPRVVYPTDNFQYLLDLTSFYRPINNWSDPNSVAIAPDPPTISSGDVTAAARADGQNLELAIRHHIFPRPKSQTDLLMAVQEAVSQLAQARIDTGNQLATESILLVSDGLSTCCLPNDPPGWPAGERFGTPNKAAICAIRCNNTYDNWNEAMTQLEDFVRVRVVPMGIPIHIMLVGEDVAPHTNELQIFDAGSGTKRCMTDSEFRSMNIRRVNGSMIWGRRPNSAGEWNFLWDNMSSNLNPNMSTDTGPFYEVNARLYQIAAMTKGRWMPIRPAYEGNSWVHSPLAPDCSNATSLTLYRRDPKHNSPEAQGALYLQDLMRTNPYSIVE